MKIDKELTKFIINILINKFVNNSFEKWIENIKNWSNRNEFLNCIFNFFHYI